MKKGNPLRVEKEKKEEEEVIQLRQKALKYPVVKSLLARHHLSIEDVSIVQFTHKGDFIESSKPVRLIFKRSRNRKYFWAGFITTFPMKLEKKAA